MLEARARLHLHPGLYRGTPDTVVAATPNRASVVGLHCARAREG